MYYLCLYLSLAPPLFVLPLPRSNTELITYVKKLEIRANFWNKDSVSAFEFARQVCYEYVFVAARNLPNWKLQRIASIKIASIKSEEMWICWFLLMYLLTSDM